MLKTYIVTVDIKESHSYEVKASSREEAYEKMHGALLTEPAKPLDWDTEEPLPGVEYGDCEVWQQSVSDYIQEVEEGE
tara:strand:- start:206 stop:439 length:234 start_codon:yes stop_codon:yes gene_type:complete